MTQGCSTHRYAKARYAKAGGGFMKLGIKTCLKWTAVAIAGALVVSVVLPGRGEAASPKVDVCHSEGNGSFHLITVAYQAIQAHRNHGDALPGEAVPGQSGFAFSDTCTLVAVSMCPCHFSLSGLAAIGIDGDAQASRCISDFGISITIGQTQAGGAPRVLAFAANQGDGGSYCASTSSDPNATGLEAMSGLTVVQVMACQDDLRAAATALGATASCF
jgi:hypothetical protein